MQNGVFVPNEDYIPSFQEDNNIRNNNKGFGLSLTSMIIGIISFICCFTVLGLILSIIAIALSLICICTNKDGKGFAIAGLSTGGAAFVFAFLILCGSMNSSGDRVGTHNTTTQNNVSNKETTKKEPETTKKPRPKDTYYIGETVKTKDAKIKFISAGEYVEENMFAQPKDGHIYYRIEFEFENIGNTDDFISTASFKGYVDGYSVSSTYSPIVDDRLSATISPGRKCKGAIYFEVPKNFEAFELEYKDNMFLSDKVIFVVK